KNIVWNLGKITSRENVHIHKFNKETLDCQNRKIGFTNPSGVIIKMGQLEETRERKICRAKLKLKKTYPTLKRGEKQLPWHLLLQGHYIMNIVMIWIFYLRYDFQDMNTINI
ncbi:hypothetical protein C0J52_19270, partial [Blattella germanica]